MLAVAVAAPFPLPVASAAWMRMALRWVGEESVSSRRAVSWSLEGRRGQSQWAVRFPSLLVSPISRARCQSAAVCSSCASVCECVRV